MNTLTGADSGYLNFLHDSLSRESQQIENETRATALKKQKLQMAARNLAGSTLMNMQGGGPQIPQPPQPGQASVAATPAPAAQASPAALPGAGGPSGGAPVQPYLSYDDHVSKASPGPTLPEPPAKVAAETPASAPAAKTTALATGPLNIGSIIKTLKQNNVADDMVMGVLDELLPVMTAENKVEYNAVKSQLDVARESHRYEIASAKNDLAEAELERKKERDREQNARGRERLTIMRDRISAENSRTQLMIRQYERLAKNGEQKQSLDRLKALNMQLGRVMQEMPGLEAAVVNGAQDVKEAAAARLEAIRMGVDQLQEQIATETNTFLGASDQGGEPAPGSPMMRPKGAVKSKEGAAEKKRPPQPTDPGFDYRYDEGRGVWQRRPK